MADKKLILHCSLCSYAMKYNVLLPFFIMVSLAALSAQDKSSVLNGQVVDADKELPLPGATVIVNDSLGQFKHAATSDEQGYFEINGILSNQYHIIISYVGYASYRGEVKIAPGQRVNMGRILLSESSAILEEVEVKAKVPPVQARGDTTEFNAGAFDTAPNSTAGQLVRKMPGMELGADGSVTAQGEQVQRVLVDGKPFFGDDPAVAMKNLPADIIEKVQVFDQQSEQSQFTGFDDGNRVRTLNIVTRVEKKEGSFGRLYGGYGTNDRAEFGGTTHRFNGDERMAVLGLANNVNEQNFATQDILNALGSTGRSGFRGRGGGVGANSFLTGNNDGLNSTFSLGTYYTNHFHEKMEFTASYFVNKNQTENNINTFREYFPGESAGQKSSETEELARDNLNHRAQLRIDYKFSDKFSVLYTPEFRWQGSESMSQSDAFSIADDGAPLNNSSVDNSHDRTGWQWENRLLFRKKFDKKGRTASLSLNADWRPGEGTFYNSSNNVFYNDQSDPDTTLISQANYFEELRTNINATLNLTESIDENTQLQMKYQFRYDNRDESGLTYSSQANPDVYDIFERQLSSDIKSDYWVQIPGVSIRKNMGHWNLNAELETQWATMSNRIQLPEMENRKLRFFNVLPSLMLSYRKKGGASFRLMYRTGTDEPGVNQLQRALDISDPLNVRTGNPELKQSYQHRLILRYSKVNPEKSTNLFAFTYFQVVKDRISNQRIISDGTTIVGDNYELGRGGQFSQPVNLDGYYSGRAYISTGKALLGQSLNLNVNLSYQLTNEPVLFNEVESNTLSHSLRPGFSLSSNISDKTDFALSGSVGLNSTYQAGISRETANYSSYSLSADVTQFITERWYVQTDISYFQNAGLAGEYENPWMLWSASAAVLLFPKKQAELKIMWYDISRQNDQIQRTISDVFLEDRQSTVLTSYLMLRFTWFINAFNSETSGRGESFGPANHGGRRSHR